VAEGGGQAGAGAPARKCPSLVKFVILIKITEFFS